MGRPKKSQTATALIEPKANSSDEKLDLIIAALGGLTAAIQGSMVRPQAVEELEEIEPKESNTKVVIKKKPGRPKKNTSSTSKNAEGVNLFDTMSEKNLHKEDTVVDKKLWRNREPTERRASNSRIECKCASCGKDVSVNPNEILSKEQRILCNSCLISRKQ